MTRAYRETAAMTLSVVPAARDALDALAVPARPRVDPHDVVVPDGGLFPWPTLLCDTCQPSSSRTAVYHVHRYEWDS